ncbi:polyphosphate polymerase domain-containing protein [Amycolatopsis acidicola]|uniref:Polyphosphate polymerase domain-containing protein n=1 Tax=Amycolatopsis acidicola TaxID=2596893 RepID=A0A5N0V0J2_9PSEU|nr:polyphosphate polymerase domain-containing protein [Amycolatopsis acidicola]KAA9157294.1 polyphosphate polymerase domain-containing protein [Amycolatopsis acidicola]
MLFRSRRRPGPTAAPDPAPAPEQNGDTGHALRGPNSLRSFNRYEVKYLVPVKQVEEMTPTIEARMDRDPYSDVTGYGVWSVYYDTRQLRFYWEKIEGLKFRRKLRLRHYGNRFDVDEDTPVYVEIKQRVNRVTQKRRIQLPYREALRLCSGKEPANIEPGARGFVEEVLDLVERLDLRPSAITGYQRQAYLGRGSELGLRVTFDQRVRGRDRDFHLGTEAENRLIVPAGMSIMEVKANERVPYWITDLAAEHNLQIVRISKYCQSVEAYGHAPRSMFHVPVDELATDQPLTVSETAHR